MGGVIGKWEGYVSKRSLFVDGPLDARVGSEKL